MTMKKVLIQNERKIHSNCQNFSPPAGALRPGGPTQRNTKLEKRNTKGPTIPTHPEFFFWKENKKGKNKKKRTHHPPPPLKIFFKKKKIFKKKKKKKK